MFEKYDFFAISAERVAKIILVQFRNNVQTYEETLCVKCTNRRINRGIMHKI